MVYGPTNLLPVMISKTPFGITTKGVLIQIGAADRTPRETLE